MTLRRRDFLKQAATLACMGSAFQLRGDGGIPRRTLGKTGRQVSILAFGCGSRFMMYKDEEQALQVLNLAIDLGINYLDTAVSYGRGESERRVGKVMKHRRQEVFLATKINARKYDDALRQMEESLKRLQTDHVDLAHIHSLGDEEDLRAIEAKDGVLRAMYRIRDEKMATFIGITSHTDPVVLKKALERHDFDCTQMALNVARVGMHTVNGKFTATEPMLDVSFETVALPVAREKNLGILAMKIFGQEALVDEAPVEKLLGYVWSLPVAAAVVGMPKLEHLKQNVELARSFRPLPAEEMRQLMEQVASRKKLALDRFFQQHLDA